MCMIFQLFIAVFARRGWGSITNINKASQTVWPTLPHVRRPGWQSVLQTQPSCITCNCRADNGRNRECMTHCSRTYHHFHCRGSWARAFPTTRPLRSACFWHSLNYLRSSVMMSADFGACLGQRAAPFPSFSPEAASAQSNLHNEISFASVLDLSLGVSFMGPGWET